MAAHDHSRSIAEDSSCLQHHLFAMVLILSMSLSGCSGWLGLGDEPEPGDMDQAQKVLVDYFQALSQGEYGAAAELYGGSYEVLISYNPDLDPADREALWERACTMNGFQCLQIGEILAGEEITGGEYNFTVQFLTETGQVYFQGPCCGANETSQVPVSRFLIHVVKHGSGAFQVLDLPPYVP